MIDLDRVSDPELLRAVAKVQDAEIRRLHDRLTTLTRQLAAAQNADAATIQEQLALLEKELREAHERAYRTGSERRPRPDTDVPKGEKKPAKGHGPTAQPRLRSRRCQLICSTPRTRLVHRAVEASRSGKARRRTVKRSTSWTSSTS